MKINLKSVENFTLNTSVFAILLLVILLVLASVDMVLQWSLIPATLERVALSVIIVTAGLAIANFLLNFLINLSILAKSINKIANKN